MENKQTPTPFIAGISTQFSDVAVENTQVPGQSMLPEAFDLQGAIYRGVSATVHVSIGESGANLSVSVEGQRTDFKMEVTTNGTDERSFKGFVALAEGLLRQPDVKDIAKQYREKVSRPGAGRKPYTEEQRAERNLQKLAKAAGVDISVIKVAMAKQNKTTKNAKAEDQEA